MALRPSLPCIGRAVPGESFPVDEKDSFHCPFYNQHYPEDGSCRVAPKFNPLSSSSKQRWPIIFQRRILGHCLFLPAVLTLRLCRFHDLRTLLKTAGITVPHSHPLSFVHDVGTTSSSDLATWCYLLGHKEMTRSISYFLSTFLPLQASPSLFILLATKTSGKKEPLITASFLSAQFIHHLIAPCLLPHHLPQTILAKVSDNLIASWVTCLGSVNFDGANYEYRQLTTILVFVVTRRFSRYFNTTLQLLEVSQSVFLSSLLGNYDGLQTTF